MKSSNKKTNIFKTAVLTISLLFIIVVILYCSRRGNNLIDMQKHILVVRTESERQKILEQLDTYYLKMFIADSIRKHVQADVDALINHRSSKLDTNVTFQDTNVYVLEKILKEMLRDAIITQIKNKKPVHQFLLSQCKIMAEIVDARTENKFWVPWVKKVESFDLAEAKTWLFADRAYNRCYSLCKQNSLLSEKYGALGFQLTEQVTDSRLRSDIAQRLFYILYRFRELYDLSFLLVEREIKLASDLKYHLRATGFLFNFAEALYLAGRNREALETYERIVTEANKHRQVPSMDWYEINGNLGAAKTNRELVNYEKALLICQEMGKLELNSSQKIQLHNIKGNTHRNLGDYDKAKEAYKRSLSLNRLSPEQDYYMQVIVLLNLGELYYRLTEYDKAIKYYDKALVLHNKHISNNRVVKIRLLTNFAETKAAQNRIDDYTQYIDEANNLTRLINLPGERAKQQRILGGLNISFQKYDKAYINFEQAISGFENNGLLRAALETKCDLVECLIGMSNYEEAKDLLEKILKLATNIHDEQCKINALGKKAEIAASEGKLDKAIQVSNKLISNIEGLSTRFTNVNNLIYFRQKIHNYLQNAVIYELKKGRVDSAFVKLDYIKARALKKQLKDEDNKNGKSYFMDIDKLKAQLNEGQLLINYFVAPDTLFAFIMDREKLQVLKKSIKIDELREQTTAYLNFINETIHVLKNLKPTVFVGHYDSVAAFSNRLYMTLLGWPEMQKSLQNASTTYIIPDDILYRIPFSCLKLSSDGDPKFLIHQTAVANLPSAILLQPGQNEKMQDTENKKKVLCSIDWTIPGSKKLYSLIKKQFPTVEKLVINKPDIKKIDVLHKLNEGYDVYIFLGHSVPDTKTPDLSFFNIPVISQVDSSVKSIAVTLAELKSVNWSTAELVCLFGCETAIGKEYKGSGLSGIQQGIILSGAQEVIASLWRIDAQQANSQVMDFFEALVQNTNSAFALQNMQKKTIQELESDSYYRKAHPYIWGSYTLLKMAN